MKPEYLITLPRRGIQIIPPAETAANMALAKTLTPGGSENPRIKWSEREKTRLWLMKKDRVMSNRYPNKQNGQFFMQEVDYDTREMLLEQARDLTKEIADKWQEINPSSPIAVVLFGSVAKGLVKNADHHDPSNIDLTVIGKIKEEEREKLLNEIRPTRNNIRELGHNAGVLVQPIERVTKNYFSSALNYISSGATALYDPERIWSKVETDALDHATKKRLKTKQTEQETSKPVTVWIDYEEDPRSRAAFYLMADAGIPFDTGIHAPIVPIDMKEGIAYFPTSSKGK